MYIYVCICIYVYIVNVLSHGLHVVKVLIFFSDAHQGRHAHEAQEMRAQPPMYRQ